MSGWAIKRPPFPQAAPKASMASTAVRSATVPTGAAATASMGPASVTRGSTAASATWVSPTDHWVLGSEGGRGHTVGWVLPAWVQLVFNHQSSQIRTRGLTEVPSWGKGPADSKSFGLCWLPEHLGGRPSPQSGWWVACRPGWGQVPPPSEAPGHRACLGFWNFLGASPEPPLGSRPPSLGPQTPRMVQGEAVGCSRKASGPHPSSSCRRIVQREAVRVPGIPWLGSASL